MKLCNLTYVPPLSPPVSGGELTIQVIFKPKEFNRSKIGRPPLQKGDKRGILFK